MKISQGTISIICGCHSIFHSIYVAKAWTKLYRRIPNWRELFCIFIHDIGHFGIDYLDNYELKQMHWKLGAKIAEKLFGKFGYDLVAGHCRYSKLPKSKLYYADKMSWHLASKYWLLSNLFWEPKIRGDRPAWKDVLWFKEQVAENVKNGFNKSTHGFYLERSRKS